MAEISVIVPVYKVEPYIRRCVDSILGQSFSDLELILVDDGSPDNSGAICDELAAGDSRIHVIHQKNSGLSAARNAGIDWVFANSSSHWLTFVDSDDWLHRDCLKLLHQAAAQWNCPMSVCAVFRTAGAVFDGETGEAPVCLSADDFYCGDLPDILPMIACGKLYQRNLFAALRYPVGKQHEDEFTTYRAVYEAGSIAVCRAPLYAYFQNPQSIMNTGWSPRRMEGIQAVEEQIAFARQTDRPRLLEHAASTHIWLVVEQLRQIRDLQNADEAVLSCRAVLREKLRSGLKARENRKKYPLSMDNVWIYEEAYPEFPVWSILHGIHGALKRRTESR